MNYNTQDFHQPMTFRKEKRLAKILFVLNLFICIWTLSYLGTPETLHEMLWRCVQTFEAAFAGAAMYGCYMSVCSLSLLEDLYKQDQRLWNENNLRCCKSKFFPEQDNNFRAKTYSSFRLRLGSEVISKA